MHTFASIRVAAIAASMAATAMPAAADLDIELLPLVQQEFRVLSEDLGAALSYKPLAPPEPLGITGFDIGVAVTGTRLKNTAVFEKASGEDISVTLPVPTFRIAKGLPFGFDIGATLAAVPDSDIRYVGGELRWAVLEGSTLTPAIGIRLAATRLGGIDDLSFRTTSVDISISKGFAIATPYGGVGHVRTKSTPKGAPQLQEEKFSKSKVFAGVNLNFVVWNLAVEADRTGDVSSGSVKFGWRF